MSLNDRITNTFLDMNAHLKAIVDNCKILPNSNIQEESQHLSIKMHSIFLMTPKSLQRYLRIFKWQESSTILVSEKTPNELILKNHELAHEISKVLELDIFN